MSPGTPWSSVGRASVESGFSRIPCGTSRQAQAGPHHACPPNRGVRHPPRWIAPPGEHARNGDSGWSGARDLRPELQLRHTARAERLHQSATHHFVHHRLFAEAHFGFGRMNVDVDLIGRHLEKQMDLRTSFLDRRHAVGIDDGVGDRPIFHDASIDEHVLRTARRPLLRQRRDVAEQPHAARVLRDLEQIFSLAIQLIQPVAERTRRWTLKDGAARAGQRKTRFRDTPAPAAW